MPKYEKGTPEYLRDRERQNRNNRRYRERKRQIKEGLKIQNELNTKSYSPQVREAKMAEMNRHFNNAQELRIKDERGVQIPGRTTQTVDARFQAIQQERAQAIFDNVKTVSKSEYQRNKKMILADLSFRKHTERADVDTFWAVTKDIWEGTDDIGERIDKILEYYDNYDFDEVFEAVTSQAKDIAHGKSFYYKVNKDEFTEEQREAYEILQSQDDSDATREYKLIVAAGVTAADIVI